MHIAYIILWVICAVSILTIVAIVVRKFPQLSNVDLESLPQEKEARTKREIMSRRLKNESGKMLASMSTVARPVIKVWSLSQRKFRLYVDKVEGLWHHEERTKKRVVQLAVSEDRELKMHTLLQEASTYLQAGAFEQAEAHYINVISLNPKSTDAYRGLADTYLAKGSVEEAEQTFQFLLKLKPDDDAAMAKLAEMAEQQGKVEQAIEYYQQAVVLNDSLSPRFYQLAELLVRVKQPEVAREAILSAIELEPKNPKYLDLLIEIGILCSDKDLALQGFNELRLVNPKNQKLQVFQDRIKELA